MLQGTKLVRRFCGAVGLVMVGVGASSAAAAPVLINMTLHATSGSQFGVTAPANITGTFNVDSSFLAQANGSYNGSAISNYHVVVGTQTFDQNTATGPDLQGLSLLNHQITGIAMNFTQTPSGLSGPYMQASEDGTWETGSTTNQDGSVILRGTSGNQSFSAVPEPGVMLVAASGLLMLRRRRGVASSC